METYDDFVAAIMEFVDREANERKVRGFLKHADGDSFEIKPSLYAIQNFKSNWFALFKRNPTIADLREKWDEFASERKERGGRRSSNSYIVHHVIEGHEKIEQKLFVDSNDKKVKNAIEWINGERRMIYQEKFGVPCQCYEDMAPWEKERWISFCIHIGYRAVKRIWTNFCESENSYFHAQPGLTIDKIWQVIGMLNRGPVHEGEKFEDSYLKEPEKLT